MAAETPGNAVRTGIVRATGLDGQEPVAISSPVASSARKFRIFPGLQPFPASVSWTLQSRAYRSGSFSSGIDRRSRILRSELLATDALTNSAAKTGNGRYSTGCGMCSSPRVTKPW